MPRYIAVEDALNAVCDSCDAKHAVCAHYPCKHYEAVKMAVKALSFPVGDTISRQDAINLLKKWSDGYVYIETDTESAIKDFQQLPSIHSEIIRCKDCKYGSPNGKYGCKCYHYTLYETHEMKSDDFCSFAERRTDE